MDSQAWRERTETMTSLVQPDNLLNAVDSVESLVQNFPRYKSGEWCIMTTHLNILGCCCSPWFVSV